MNSVWERIWAKSGEVREIPLPIIGDFNYFLSVLILDLFTNEPPLENGFKWLTVSTRSLSSDFRHLDLRFHRLLFLFIIIIFFRNSVDSIGCTVAIMWTVLARLCRLGICRFPGTGPRLLVRNLLTE